eukprot:7386744-Prymnesium_polylepis.2
MATKGPTSGTRKSLLQALRSRNRPIEWFFRVKFTLSSPVVARPKTSPSLWHEASLALQATRQTQRPRSVAQLLTSATSAAIVSAEPTSDSSSTDQRPHLGESGSCETVNKLVLMYVMDRHAAGDVLNRYDVGNTPKVMFWTIQFDRSGTIRPPGWLHAHRARHAGYVLVAGKHTLASLTGLPAACGVPGNLACSSVREARRLLLNRAGELTLCHDEPLAPQWVSRAELGDGTGGIFDRQGYTSCKPFSFAKGDFVTVFSFAHPNWAVDQEVFPQHTMFFFHFTPTDSNPYSTVKQLMFSPTAEGSCGEEDMGNGAVSGDVVQSRRVAVGTPCDDAGMWELPVGSVGLGVYYQVVPSHEDSGGLLFEWRRAPAEPEHAIAPRT